ncbi:cytochrome c oxidase subunit II [Brucella melitensis]|nr:cytochrome c oxidase subunit II [Brucella melitensis]
MGVEISGRCNGDCEQIHWFERLYALVIIPITLLVLGLLVWVVLRFRASVNPEPSKTSHNTAIEVIWTVGPVIILLFPCRAVVPASDRRNIRRKTRR